MNTYERIYTFILRKIEQILTILGDLQKNSYSSVKNGENYEVKRHVLIYFYLFNIHRTEHLAVGVLYLLVVKFQHLDNND